MHDGYRRIFWGIFFLTFHINLGQLQILPTFVGFLIIRSGINMLYSSYSSDLFNKASKITIIAAITSLIGAVIELGYMSLELPSFFSTLWMGLILLIEIIYIFYLLEGSTDLLKYYQYNEMAESYILKNRVYLIIFSLTTIAIIISFTFSIDTIMLLASIVMIIMRIWLMVMVSTLKKTEFKQIETLECESLEKK